MKRPITEMLYPLPLNLLSTKSGETQCVVAPPGERSVGAGRGERVSVDAGSQVEESAEGVGVSVEGPGWTFAREHYPKFYNMVPDRA